jgi:hypothetical protein
MSQEIILADTKETPWSKAVISAFPQHTIHQLKCSDDAKVLMLKLCGVSQDALAVIARFPLPRYEGDSPDLLYTTVLCQCIRPDMTKLIFVADRAAMYMAPGAIMPWKGADIQIVEENDETESTLLKILARISRQQTV